MRILGFEQFLTNFSIEFELARDQLSRSTRLIADLDFDSFQFFRLMILIESLTPIELPEELDFETLTLGSVYDFYAVQAGTAELR